MGKMRVYLVHFKDSSGNDKTTRLVAENKESARKRILNKGAKKVIKVETLPPANKIRPLTVGL